METTEILLLILSIITFFLLLVWIIINELTIRKLSNMVKKLEGLENKNYANESATSYICPYDIKKRSCPYVNSLDMILSKRCDECEWYNSSIRSSKF